VVRAVSGQPLLVARVASAGFAFVLITCVGGVVGWIVWRRRLKKKLPLDKRARIVGAVAGGVEGVVTVLVVCWVFSMFHTAAVASSAKSGLVAWAGRRGQSLRGTAIGRVARATNPIAPEGLMEQAEAMPRIMASKRATQALRADPAIRNLLAAPSVQRAVTRLRNDRAFIEAVRKRRFREILSNPNLRALLDDAEVLDEFSRHEQGIRRALTRASRIAAEEAKKK